MAPAFGTSGLRGLVTELTPDLVADHVRAFLHACETGTGLFVGRDLRESSPRIAGDVIAAARAEGVDVTDCGALPTPALALAAMTAGAGAVMVTGSHIPADRNGLKFYRPDGEIDKTDEAAILAALGRAPGQGAGALHPDPGAAEAYVQRYVRAYGPALQGLRLGVWSHSGVARDLLRDLLTRLGAEVTELDRSDSFIPVDTEAVEADVADRLALWAQGLDAILSTDGDADRPLLVDGTGAIVPGDVLGQIAGVALGAEVAVTPVSANSGAETVFPAVIRTRIGSPYVIAGMERAQGRVVGYEPNGGFLLGFDAEGPAGPLPALKTRDAVLPMVAALAAGLTERLAAQPPRVCARDRLEDVPTDASAALLARLDDAEARADLLADLDGTEVAIDRTDGLRMTLADGRILHLRPSGNAPEFRVYVEADEAAAARATLERARAILRDRLGDATRAP